MKNAATINTAFNITVNTGKGKPASYQCSNNVLSEHLAFETEEDAIFASVLADKALANGLSANDFQHLLPIIFRIFKDQSIWAQ